MEGGFGCGHQTALTHNNHMLCIVFEMLLAYMYNYTYGCILCAFLNYSQRCGFQNLSAIHVAV